MLFAVASDAGYQLPRLGSLVQAEFAKRSWPCSKQNIPDTIAEFAQNIANMENNPFVANRYICD
jgi:hypothetical protein